MKLTGSQFKAIRQRLKLEQLEWGRALGYTGEIGTITRQMRRFENEGHQIPIKTRRLAIMFDRHGVPADFL